MTTMAAMITKMSRLLKSSIRGVLFARVLKFRDLAVALPKLDIVPVYTFGILFRDLIVRADKLD